MDCILIGPKVEDSTILDETEYETVAAALKLERSESKDARALASALRWCQNSKYPLRDWESDRHPILRRFLSETAEGLGECVDDVKGMISLWDEHPVLLLEKKGERQAEAIQALLKIFEDQEWLADFLLLSLPNYAKERPTPMQVLWELTEKATEFQMHVDTTEHMLANWRKHIPALKEQEQRQAPPQAPSSQSEDLEECRQMLAEIRAANRLVEATEARIEARLATLEEV